MTREEEIKAMERREALRMQIRWCSYKAEDRAKIIEAMHAFALHINARKG